MESNLAGATSSIFPRRASFTGRPTRSLPRILVIRCRAPRAEERDGLIAKFGRKPK
jgi:hypothetical protein